MGPSEQGVYDQLPDSRCVNAPGTAMLQSFEVWKTITKTRDCNARGDQEDGSCPEGGSPASPSTDRGTCPKIPLSLYIAHKIRIHTKPTRATQRKWRSEETTGSSVEEGTIHTKFDIVDLQIFRGLHPVRRCGVW